MTQNLRVDILYHKIPTDFEMEFQLSGCCRMRLSTEKTGTKSDFLNGLAAAASRSRIIIATGGLFSDEGLIKTVAAAINKKTVFVDASEYGMTGEKIEIIDGSVPLITSDGLFGGCIIESGPQSIILLTDNKPIRKSVMKSLIHPYVTEISAIPEEAYSDIEPQEEESLPETEPQEETPEIPETEEIPEVEEETEEGEIPEAEQETEVQEEEKSEVSEKSEEEEQPFKLEMFTEPGFENKKFKGGYYGETPENYDDMGLYFGDDIKDEKPPKTEMSTLFLAIICVICFICAAALIFMLLIHPLINGEPIGEYISELFELTSDTSNL